MEAQLIVVSKREPYVNGRQQILCSHFGRAYLNIKIRLLLFLVTQATKVRLLCMN